MPPPRRSAPAKRDAAKLTPLPGRSADATVANADPASAGLGPSTSRRGATLPSTLRNQPTHKGALSIPQRVMCHSSPHTPEQIAGDADWHKEKGRDQGPDEIETALASLAAQAALPTGLGLGHVNPTPPCPASAAWQGRGPTGQYRAGLTTQGGAAGRPRPPPRLLPSVVHLR